eukprot:COSAG02_NODE_38425_length_429_cov_0.778788_1_plen_77_part_01
MSTLLTARTARLDSTRSSGTLAKSALQDSSSTTVRLAVPRAEQERGQKMMDALSAPSAGTRRTASAAKSASSQMSCV